MKCIHCGSQWNSITTVRVCPFCQKPLNPPTQKPATLLSALTQLRDQLGPDALNNGKALVSAFKDMAPELTKEHTMLAYLEKCGGVRELFQAKDKAITEQNIAVSRVVRRMVDELMVNEAAAQTICRTYMQVLTGRELPPENAALAPTPKPSAPVQKPIETPKPVAPPKPANPPAKPAAPAASNTDRAYHNEKPATPPKPPVTPPKPATPPTPAPTPQKATTAKSSAPPLMKLFGILFFPVWGLAYYFYIMGVEPLYVPGDWSFHIALVVLTLLHWFGRHLLKNDHVFWGFILIFFAAGWTVMFYRFAPGATANNVAQVAYALLCAVTSFCSGPIFRRNKH